MKKSHLITVIPCLLLAFLPSALHAEETVREQYRVAVMDLNVKTEVKAEIAELLTDTLRTTVYRTNAFEMLNREDMNAILKEMAFQQSGACDDTSCIVEMGGALGVEKMIAGSIGMLGERYSVTVKLVDIAKAKNDVLITQYYDGKIEKMPEFIKKMGELLVEEATGVKVKRHSATRAALFGVVPGLGQLYNGETKKGALFAALGGTGLVGALLFKSQANKAIDDYDQAGYGADFESIVERIDDNRLYNKIFIGITGAVIAASIADSYYSGKVIAEKQALIIEEKELRLAYAFKF